MPSPACRPERRERRNRGHAAPRGDPDNLVQSWDGCRSRGGTTETKSTGSLGAGCREPASFHKGLLSDDAQQPDALTQLPPCTNQAPGKPLERLQGCASCVFRDSGCELAWTARRARCTRRRTSGARPREALNVSDREHAQRDIRCCCDLSAVPYCVQSEYYSFQRRNCNLDNNNYIGTPRLGLGASDRGVGSDERSRPCKWTVDQRCGFLRCRYRVGEATAYANLTHS